MTTATHIDWSDIEAATREMAGNWKKFICFVWYRASDLEDADRWMIWYTSHRDAGLLEQSNEKAINERLAPFAEGDDPDVVFECHSSSLIGYLGGFSLRVVRPDGTITDVFREFCRIKERLDDYPILDEQDYGEREYEATLENYRSEMWRLRAEHAADGSLFDGYHPSMKAIHDKIAARLTKIIGQFGWRGRGLVGEDVRCKRADLARSPEKPPRDWADRQRRFAEWARAVGWWA